MGKEAGCARQGGGERKALSKANFTHLILVPGAETKEGYRWALLGKPLAQLQTFVLKQLLYVKMSGICYFFYIKTNTVLLWGSLQDPHGYLKRKQTRRLQL